MNEHPRKALPTCAPLQVVLVRLAPVRVDPVRFAR